MSSSTERSEKYKKRINDVLESLEGPDGGRPRCLEDSIHAAFFGVLKLLDDLYGEGGNQVKILIEERIKYQDRSKYQREEGQVFLADSIKGVLKNLKAEIAAGLVSNLSDQAAGEVYGDLLTMAQNALDNGDKDVASVLACAALEDVMKRKAEELGMEVEGKGLDEVVNYLKSKSYFRGAEKKLASSFISLRNAALHADWEKVNDAAVGGLLGFLKPFVAAEFS